MAEDLGVVVTKVQLLLTEKQVALALLRTGLAVYAVPLSVLSVLIATSRYYTLSTVLHLAVPLFLVCAGLLALATWMVVLAIERIRRFDRLIRALKKGHPDILGVLE